MNILYLTMSYNLNTKGLYQFLVDELVNNGHNVTIVRSAYNDVGTRSVIINDRLKCLSVKTGNPFEKNLIKKGINQVFLNFYFKNAIKKNLLDERYDLILYATPPITLCNVIKFCKNYYHAKTFLMLKDIFPQNAIDLGMMKSGGIIHYYFRKKEKEYYRYSDYIGCMSKGNVEYVKKNNSELEPDKLHVFYNSIKIEDDKNKSFFNEGITKFVFGGNIGKPQNILFLLEVVDALSEYNNAKFVFVGKGSEDKYIKQYCKEKKSSNIQFQEYLPPVEYEKLLASADVGLISLDPRFTIPNIPSKFQTYLKLKKPILAITDRSTDLKEMILDNDCGWWCDASNIEAVIHLIKHICEDKNGQIEKGLNGYHYLKREFDVKKNIKQIECFISQS